MSEPVSEPVTEPVTEPDGRPDGPPAGRRRLLTLLVVVALIGAVVAVVLARRGDDDPYAAYCSVVTDEQRTIGAALTAGATTGLLRALPAFERLQEQAPRDIRDDWSVVVSRVRGLRDALQAAKVAPGSYDPAKPPAGLSDAARSAIETAAVRLGARDTALALASVQQQARDVCKTPLSL